MDNQDIFDEALPMIAAARGRIAIWGAGLHGQWLARQLGNRCAGFVDSNPLKAGTSILGLPVTSPEALDLVDADSVWIAVLSDAGSIAHALEHRGRTEGKGYEFPFRRGKLLQVLSDWLPQASAFLSDLPLEGRSALETGSGGRFFLAMTLLHAGAARVEVTDAAVYPADTLEREAPLLKDYLSELRTRWPQKPTANRSFDDMMSRLTMLAAEVSTTSLPHAAGSVDAVVNSGVMEHVFEPAKAFTEMARVLRPGGLALCLAIGIHDHRYNARDGKFSPWTFLEETTWADNPDNRYHQNRCRPADFRQMCGDAGFNILRDRTDVDHRLSADDVKRFASAFQGYSLLELRELNHWLAAEKR